MGSHRPGTPKYSYRPLIIPLSSLHLLLRLLRRIIPKYRLYREPGSLTRRLYQLSPILYICTSVAIANNSTVVLFYTSLFFCWFQHSTFASKHPHYIPYNHFGYQINSALMSVEARQCLYCLRYPSRFETVATSQLSKVHTGELTRPIDNP